LDLGTIPHRAFGAHEGATVFDNPSQLHTPVLRIDAALVHAGTADCDHWQLASLERRSRHVPRRTKITKKHHLSNQAHYTRPVLESMAVSPTRAQPITPTGNWPCLDAVHATKSSDKNSLNPVFQYWVVEVHDQADV
jgi:hypothetical protein